MIVDELNKLIETKASIKQALIDKGQNPTDEFASYADNISNIVVGGDYDFTGHPDLIAALEYAKEIKDNPNPNGYSYDKKLLIFPYLESLTLYQSNGPGGIRGMFYDSALTYFPEGMKIIGSGSSTIGAFQGTLITKCDLRNLTITEPCDMSQMFAESSLSELLINEDFGKNTKSFSSCFSNCKKLKQLPEFTITSTCTSLSNIVYQCDNLESLVIKGDASNVQSVSSMCYGCSKLTSLTIPDRLRASGAMFYNTRIERINGSIVCPIYSFGAYEWIWGFSKNSYIRYSVVKDIGLERTQTSVDFTYADAWGVNSDTIPDAKQSLLDSLITYSFDRTSKEYSACRVILASKTKAVLTEDEIAQITAKGYTIA